MTNSDSTASFLKLPTIASSSFEMLNKVPRIWRMILLFALSNVVASTLLREKLVEFIRKIFSNSEVKGGTKLAHAELVPLAKHSNNWLASLLLGHFADAEPWTAANRKVGFMMNILNRRFKWYDDVKDKSKSVRVKLVMDDFVFTHDLEMIRAINGKEDRMFRNSDTIRAAWGVLFPDSVTVRTGEKWKRVRRVLVSAMNKLDFEILPPSTNTVLETGLNAYVTQNEQEVFLWDVFAKVTFDSFHKFVYNINFETVSGKNLQVLEDLMTIATKVSDRLLISFPLIWKLPTETNKTLWECHGRLCGFVDEYVEKRTQAFKDGNYQSNQKSATLLDALILACHEDSNTASDEEDGSQKKHLTREEMRAQLCAAMFGGFDTTSSSMSFITINLAKHPHVQQKLYEEVKDIDLSIATGSQLGDLPYLNSVIKETLRMNAVAPAIARIPNEDVVIGGYLIKAGTNILADHEKLGQDPENWDGMKDLNEFRPERWIETTPAKLSFFPFGFGGRMCPGYKVANAQMQIIVTFLIQNYTIGLSQRPIKIVSSLGRTVSRDTSVMFYKRNPL